MDPVFPERWRSLRVVLSHDWLTGMRGGERVLELLCQGFPDAPVFTLLHANGAVSETIARHDIVTSWLQRVPGIRRYYRNFLPFFPGAIERLRPPSADLLISTSHCVAKGLCPRQGTKHLCYCFTPMRYAWSFYGEYFGKNPLKKATVKPLLAVLRRWDVRVSDRVDRFVAISQHVQRRIKTFYGRDADVVYPPVDTGFYTPGENSHDDFDLIVSALVPYKRIDLAVETYNHLQRPLKIVGVGTEFPALARRAGRHIDFLGWRSDEEIRELYRRCRMLVFPGEEDFGIVPVEAQACGKPVVAYARGGALETIQAGRTGVFFDEQHSDSLAQAVEACAAQSWSAETIRANAERFGMDRFLRELDGSIQTCLEAKT